MRENIPPKERQQVNQQLETLLAYKGSWIKTIASTWRTQQRDRSVLRYVINLINYKSEIVLTCERKTGKVLSSLWKDSASIRNVFSRPMVNMEKREGVKWLCSQGKGKTGGCAAPRSSRCGCDGRFLLPVCRAEEPRLWRTAVQHPACISAASNFTEKIWRK